MDQICSLTYSAAEASFAVDIRGRIIAFNSAAEALFGVRRDTVVGKRCWHLVQGKDTNGNDFCMSMCSVRNMSREKRAVNPFRLTIQTPSGRPRVCRVTVMDVQTDEGSQGIVHIITPEDHHHHHLTSTSAASPFLDVDAENQDEVVLSRREFEVLSRVVDGLTERLRYMTDKNDGEKKGD